MNKIHKWQKARKVQLDDIHFPWYLYHLYTTFYYGVTSKQTISNGQVEDIDCDMDV